MAALRLIDALPDFGTPLRTDMRAVASPATVAPPPSPVDVGEIVRAEVERAEQSVMMRLTVEHEAALLAEQQRHQESAEALVRKLGEETGGAITTRFAELERSVGEHVSEVVARLLGGVLSDNLRQRSLQSLARSIEAAIRDTESLRIDVRGPQSLFAGLSAVLPERAANLHHVEAEGFDLSVTLDGTVFETRLAEWSAVLSEILA
ncbi:hypothetical protein ACSBOB_10670 [Mesorhizobium sp. ASY16-5R]|uniref:hypothetical protein n=1 Tax=Mesorhizobium sp. ASY16-5R TaxID=3445772 RepID=UPI003F9F8E45